MSSNDRYTVLFSGQTDPEFDPAQVRRDLGELLHADEAGIERLFSGKPVAVKKKTDRRSAEKTVAALRRTGALCKVKKHRAGNRTAPPPVPPPAFEEDNPFLETMVCPKCGKEQQRSGTCVQCGIIFAKYRAEAESASSSPSTASSPSLSTPSSPRSDSGATSDGAAAAPASFREKDSKKKKKKEYVPSLIDTTEDFDSVMKCPNCAAVQATASACAHCGVIIAKAKAIQRRKEEAMKKAAEANKKIAADKKARARKKGEDRAKGRKGPVTEPGGGVAGGRPSKPGAKPVPLSGSFFTRLFTMSPGEFSEVAAWALIVGAAGAFLGYTGWGILHLHYDPGAADAFLNALVFAGWAVCFGLSMIAGRNFQLFGSPGEFRAIAFFAGGFWIAAIAMTNRMLDPAVADPVRATIIHMLAGFFGGGVSAFFASRRLSRMLPPGVSKAPLPGGFRAKEGVGLFFTAGYALIGCVVLLIILGYGRSQGYLDPERSILPEPTAKELSWEFKADAPLTHVISHPERSVLTFASGRVLTINPKNGQPVWEITVDETIAHRPARVNNTLFLPLTVTGSGSIVSLDIQNGRQYRREDLPVSFHSAAFYNGAAWLPGYGSVEKLSLTNWRSESFPATPHSQLPHLPPVAAENRIVIPSSMNGLQVMGTDGALLWEAPALSRDPKEMIVGFGLIRGTVCLAAGQMVRGWDLNGKQIWDYQAPSPIRQLLAKGSRIYIATETGCAALHPGTGEEIWTWREQELPFRSLVLHRDMLYAATGGTDRKVYRLQSLNGKIRDRYQMDLDPALFLIPEIGVASETATLETGVVLVYGVNPRSRHRIYALPLKLD